MTHRIRMSAFALFLLLGAGAARAAQTSILEDPLFQQDAKQGLQYLYDMDFGAADEIFTQIIVRSPDHPVGPFLRALIPFWAIQLEPDDTSQDEDFLTALDGVIDLCDRRLAADPEDIDALFFKSGAHAFRGRLHSDRERWLRAARDGQQALSALKKVRERMPENDDIYFGIGLFDYLADEAPRQYKILRPFKAFFPRGDRERGLAELERAMTRGTFVPTEVAYSLLQIHYLFEENYKESLRHSVWLRQRHPDNSLFHLYEGRIYERMGRLQDANRVFHQVLERHAKGQSGYTDAVAERALYLLTRVEMRFRRYNVAMANLARLEQLTSRRDIPSEYKALGRLRKGMVYDATGQRKDAVRCYKDVLAMRGDNYDNARDRAKDYLKKPYQG